MHPGFDRNFLQQSNDLILNFVEETLEGSNQVINLKQPEELKSIIDFSIKTEPTDEKQLLSEVKKVLDHQVKPYHPGFMNTLFGGFDQFSAAGAMMIPFINGTMYTYQMAPCFTLMENQLYSMFKKILEWEQIDGLMTPGGSFANIMGILTARYHAFPESRIKGIQHLPPLRIFTSDVSHYSFKKGSILCGSGVEGVVPVKSDLCGRMDPKCLDEAIQEEIQKGNKPCMVCATVGTTVQGAIDDVEEIGKVCEKYSVWLHVDASYAGVFMMSSNLKAKLGSLKKADSFCWNPHKGLLVPLQASFFLCKHRGLMNQSNATSAQYLFHKQRAYYDNDLDTGNKSIQCGRVIDIFKIWTYLKGNGLKNISQQIDKKYQLAVKFMKRIQENPKIYKLIFPEVGTFNVCFWCIPQILKEEDKNEKMLGKITVLAKKYMIQEGKLLVGYSSTKNMPYFWRIVFSNPHQTEKDFDAILPLLMKYCEQAYKEITLENQKKQPQN